jgi:hypothetical protein
LKIPNCRAQAVVHHSCPSAGLMKEYKRHPGGRNSLLAHNSTSLSIPFLEFIIDSLQINANLLFQLPHGR